MACKEGRRMITTSTLHTGNLKIGDLIAVAENSYIHIGFFAGRGINNSFQYWTMDQLCMWLDPEGWRRKKGKLPYKFYHNSVRASRVIKISPEFFTNESMEMYEKSLEALRLLKVIEDFETNVLKSK